MKISARIIYDIPEELVHMYFPNRQPTIDEILNTILEDHPDWEDIFADHWTNWRIEE